MSTTVEKTTPIKTGKFEKQITKFRNAYKRNIVAIKKEFENKKVEEDGKQTEEGYIMNALLEAERIWLHIQTINATNYQEFQKMNDSQKIDLVKSNFKEFYTEFPIVSRYMVCLIRYRRKAFKKMLLKCKNTNIGNDKTSNEDKWIERQADYVRYLWEECQTSRFPRKESDAVWKRAFDSLKDEFKQFNKLHETTEEKVTKNDNRYKSELLTELKDKIYAGESIDETSATTLMNKLKTILYKQRYSKVIKEIKELVELKPATVYGVGTNERARKEHDSELKYNEQKKKYQKLNIGIPNIS